MLPTDGEEDSTGDDDYSLEDDKGDEEDESKRDVVGLSRRYLVEDKIYATRAPCHTCPSEVTNSTCHVSKTYKANNKVISQCWNLKEVDYPNGTIDSEHSTIWLVSCIGFSG